MSEAFEQADLPVTRDHRRQWRDCLYVYPVIARRSKGLSIGVNLNPDKRCTFSCLYCQINRRVRRDLQKVDMAILGKELELALAEATSGRLWQEERFAATPEALRRLNDIALSGDGEPTCLPDFDKAVEVAARARAKFNLTAVKIIVLTNATQFDQPQFHRALPILDANSGEIWAKLDAGTEAYFQRINRPCPGISLRKIIDNITAVARGRDVVIQSLFCRLRGRAPGAEEIAAYCQRLAEILAGGGRLRLIQVHTIARPPAERDVSALPDEKLQEIARTIRGALPGLCVETYPGTDVEPQA